MKKIFTVGVLLFFTLMIGCGGDEGNSKTTAVPNASFFLMEYDAAASPDQKYSIHEVFANGKDKVLAVAPEGSTIPDSLSSFGVAGGMKPMVRTSGMGAFEDVEALYSYDVEDGGATAYIKGTTGLVYVLDGKLYYYQKGMTEPQVVDLGKVVTRVSSDDLSAGNIVKVYTDDDYAYYLNLKTGNKLLREDDGRNVGYIDEDYRVYKGSDYLGVFYNYASTTNTYSFTLWKFCNADLSKCVDYPSLTGTDFWRQSSDYVYFYKNIVNTTDKYFERDYFAVSKENIEGGTSESLTKDGIPYNTKVYFNEIFPDEVTTYLFTSRYIRTGQVISQSSLDNYKCINDDLTQCYIFAALEYDEATNSYTVVDREYISNIVSENGSLSFMNGNKFVSDKGLFGTKIVKETDDNGNSYYDVSVIRVNGREVKTVNHFTTNNIFSNDEIDVSSVDFRQMVTLGNSLYYYLSMRVNVEYKGDPKPYPSPLSYTPDTVDLVERGTVSYNSQYVKCYGYYTKDASGNYDVTYLRCYYDENKDGDFRDANDITCTDSNHNDSFDEGECDYYNSDSFYNYELCKMDVDSVENSACPVVIKNYEGFGDRLNAIFWNNYFLVFGDFDFLSPVEALNLETGEEKTLAGSYDFEVIPTGYKNGFVSGWLILFGGEQVNLVDPSSDEVISFSPIDFNDSATNYVDPMLLYNDGYLGVFMHVYPPNKYYPYAPSEFSEKYGLFLLTPGGNYDVWSDEINIGNGDLIRSYFPLDGFPLFR